MHAFETDRLTEFSSLDHVCILQYGNKTETKPGDQKKIYLKQL